MAVRPSFSKLNKPMLCPSNKEWIQSPLGTASEEAVPFSWYLVQVGLSGSVKAPGRFFLASGRAKLQSTGARAASLQVNQNDFGLKIPKRLPTGSLTGSRRYSRLGGL